MPSRENRKDRYIPCPESGCLGDMFFTSQRCNACTRRLTRMTGVIRLAMDCRQDTCQEAPEPHPRCLPPGGTPRYADFDGASYCGILVGPGHESVTQDRRGRCEACQARVERQRQRSVA